MKKSEEFLESKKQVLNNLDTIITPRVVVSIEDAKTSNRIVELEKDLEYWTIECSIQPTYQIKTEIEKIKSEIEALMKS